ncbi:hypothetical protein ACMU_09240 [Actibacterium mucosum KCTC 23349]|uniref:Apolipoprotein N-acyltransferase n=1 Tax=Actibacterium mucosum KCTC 23349 TaxID=1454373 RepID=A0A037ZK00_9RHOB|nr:apolipoprotein N-acyltransferase [Actibacterium mucosum]KAJ55939.1 hypothetical protein ACMU_09240 [Actibacterium mucosum KCTC 23349]
MSPRADGLWARGVPRRLILPACFLSGAVAATGLAPLGLWPLALLGLAAVLWLVGQGENSRATARRAWVAGAGYFALALAWIVEPFLVDIAKHGWMAPFALLLMSFGLALFWAVAGTLAGWLGTGWRSRIALFLPALALMELSRGYVFTGFPWALIGHHWIDTPVVQLAAFTGAHGLSALSLLVVALPLLWGARGLAGGVAVVAAVWVFGTLQPAPPAAPDAPTLRLVQPNAAQHLKWRPDMVPVFWRRMMAQTAAPGAPDVVIWPETSVPYFLENADQALAAMAQAADGTPIIAGIRRWQENRIYNSLIAIDPLGRVSHQYDKHHLVPFGEYMPFAATFARLGIFGLAAEDTSGYTPGPGAAVLNLGGALGTMLPLICYEAIFPQDLRAAPTRPDWVLQITNDAWFGRFSGPYQHLDQARLRAVEMGLPVVRVANTGVSAVIDARGQVTHALALNTAGFLDAPLPAALPETPYARIGDAPAGGAFLLLLGLIIAFRRRLPH